VEEGDKIAFLNKGATPSPKPRTGVISTIFARSPQMTVTRICGIFKAEKPVVLKTLGLVHLDLGFLYSEGGHEPANVVRGKKGQEMLSRFVGLWIPVVGPLS